MQSVHSKSIWTFYCAFYKDILHFLNPNTALTYKINNLPKCRFYLVPQATVYVMIYFFIWNIYWKWLFLFQRSINEWHFHLKYTQNYLFSMKDAIWFVMPVAGLQSKLLFENWKIQFVSSYFYQCVDDIKLNCTEYIILPTLCRNWDQQEAGWDGSQGHWWLGSWEGHPQQESPQGMLSYENLEC